MSVEYGFSLDNNILKTNVGSETVIAKRLIIEHVVVNKLKSHTIEMTKFMLKAFRSAHSSYKTPLEEEKKKISLSEHDEQAIHISDYIKLKR